MGNVDVGQTFESLGGVAADRPTAAERAPERDDLPDAIGVVPAQAPGEHATQAPPHQTHRGAGRLGQAHEALFHPLEDFEGRTYVASQAPSTDFVTEGAEVAP